MCINYFPTKEDRFSLPSHCAGHEDGDIESTQTQSMSPHSSETDIEQNMGNKPPAAEMLTYTRLNRSKHLATSKKKEKIRYQHCFYSWSKKAKEKGQC